VIPQPAITRQLDKLLAGIPFQGKDRVLALTPDTSANCSSVSRAARR
jgi:hypothetical protein